MDDISACRTAFLESLSLLMYTKSMFSICFVISSGCDSNRDTQIT